MARETLAFDADVSEATAVSGFLTQLSKGMQTDRHLAPVVEAAHATMSQDFVANMSVLAISNPESYHHVYEWGDEHRGNPSQTSRLWKDVLRGRGAKRTATFDWRPSVTTVPVPSIPAGPQGQQLKQIHVFTWKAPVMEYDLSVHINPKTTPVIAFPTGDSSNPLWFSKTGLKFPFRPGRFQRANGESRLRASARTPGRTAGMFTTAYIGWWGGPGGQMSFDKGIGHEIHHSINLLPIEKAAAPFRRASTKTFRLNVATDAKAAYSHGVGEAEKWLVNRDRKYYAMARARRGNA